MPWNLRCFDSFLCFFMLLSFFLFSACAHRGDNVSLRWLTGTTNEKFHDVERHLGGFGAAMWEVGYRYTALYWAGEDENWLYADYQLDKLVGAINLAMERRVGRAASARIFLDESVPHMQEGIESENKETFRQKFALFRAGCNACHAREELGFIRVAEPGVRFSPVR